MPKRSSKQASRDIDEMAARVLAEATGESTERIAPEEKEKNPAAVAWVGLVASRAAKPVPQSSLRNNARRSRKRRLA